MIRITLVYPYSSEIVSFASSMFEILPRYSDHEAVLVSSASVSNRTCVLFNVEFSCDIHTYPALSMPVLVGTWCRAAYQS
jgi:hypothetical protein